MKYTPFALLLTFFALATGCNIHDDTDDCDNTVVLSFSYKGDGNTQIFNEKMSSLDLYVFDGNNQVVEGYGPYRLSASELESQSVTMKLPTKENYHAVCVGNADFSVTHRLHEGSVYDTRLMHPVTHPDMSTEGELIDDFDHLYHGELPLELTRTGEVSGTVPVNSSHFDVLVEVVGHDNIPSMLSRAEGEPVVAIEHEGVPAWVDFSNQWAETETESKHPQGALLEDPDNPGMMAHIYEYCVKRNVEGSKIHVRDLDGTLVGTVDVSKFLDENSEIREGLTKQEALLPIRIEIKKDGVINVSISKWDIIKAKPEF